MARTVALLLASATALVPPATAPARPATQLAYTASQSLPFMERPASLDELEMAGDVGFDPFGFSSVFNVKWLREAEIKHGRICMLAWTGFVATDLGFTLPGDMHQVSSVEAHDVACKYGAMQQIFLWISFVEVVHSFGVAQMMWMGSDRQPGDFGSDRRSHLHRRARDTEVQSTSGEKQTTQEVQAGTSPEVSNSAARSGP